MQREDETFIVVVGSAGVGKSHFVDQQVEEQVVSQDGGWHVTTEQRTYRSKENPNFYFVDTVGLDIRGFTFDLTEIQGKRVCFVAILSRPRFEDEKEEVLKKIPVSNEALKRDICYFYAWHRDEFNGVRHIKDFCLSDIATTHLVPVPKTRVSTPQKKNKNKGNKNSNKGRKLSTAEIMFAKLNHELTDEERRLVNLFESGAFVKLPQQSHSPNFRAIAKIEEVKQHRAKGESLLKYFLFHMGVDGADVEHLLSNDTLCSRARKAGLEEHILQIYGNPEQGLTPEKYADYIEALFDVVFVTNRFRSSVIGVIELVLGDCSETSEPSTSTNTASVASPEAAPVEAVAQQLQRALHMNGHV